jgi:hypothetical protein
VYYYELVVVDQGIYGKIAIGFADKSFKLTRQPGCVVMTASARNAPQTLDMRRTRSQHPCRFGAGGKLGLMDITEMMARSS